MSLEAKIANLLNKAENTDNPHEAEAFMAKAEEMMLKNGIDRANLEVHLPGNRREAIVTVRWTIPNGSGYAMAEARVAHAVAPSFDVRSFETNLGGRKGRMIWYVGHKSDVAQVRELAESLVAQSRSQAKHWWKTEGKAEQPLASSDDAFYARRQFITSFAEGVESRLYETRKKVVAEAAPGTALVLADRGQLVTTWVEDNMNVGKARGSSAKGGGSSARSAGRSAGRSAISPKSLR